MTQLTTPPFDVKSIAPLSIPNRVLMGAGPSASYPEVLRAMSANTLGHLDPEFIDIMNGVGAMLRQVFRTENRVTGAVSATGTAGMEAALCNLIEPGDEVLVPVAGYFADRMLQMVTRMGGKVKVIERPWGTAFTPEEIEAALQEMDAPKVVAAVHAETSTGVLHPVHEYAKIAHKYGALLVADCVTSLAGCPVLVDEWEWDACFSGTQKCIGAPPGLSPVTFSERAMQKVRARKTPVQSWYFDMSLVETYWGDSSGGRAYHHTAPSNALFGLYEALRMTLVEGLENRWSRHELHSNALMAGLEAMGLEPFAQEGYRLWQLNIVQVPDGIDDAKVRGRLLRDYQIEIGGGLGPIKGQVWRIGTMGYSAQRANIDLVLTALETILRDEGFKLVPGAALEAATRVYHENTQSETPAAQFGDVPLKTPTLLEAQGETTPAESVAVGVAHHES